VLEEAVASESVAVVDIERRRESRE
jgi:hypothetical protein